MPITRGVRRPGFVDGLDTEQSSYGFHRSFHATQQTSEGTEVTDEQYRGWGGQKEEIGMKATVMYGAGPWLRHQSTNCFNCRSCSSDHVRDSLHAYQLSKRGNSLRVMAEAVRWGKRGVLARCSWALTVPSLRAATSSWMVGSPRRTRSEGCDRWILSRRFAQPKKEGPRCLANAALESWLRGRAAAGDWRLGGWPPEAQLACGYGALNVLQTWAAREDLRLAT